MPITVECPACEQIFRISSKYRNRKGRCPLCDCSFIADETVITSVNETISASGKPKRPASIPLPTAVRGGKSVTAPPVPPSPPGSEQDGDVAAIDPSVAGSVDDRSFSDAAEQSMIAQELQARKGVSPVLIGVVGVLLFAIGTGIAFAVSYATRRTDIAEAKPEDKKNEKTDAQTDIIRTPGDDDKKETAKTKTASEEMPVSMSMDQLHRNWSTLSPFMVQLEIQTPSGKVIASGIIIDSRGWVATSYSAIKDAVHVRTTLAAQAFRDGPALKEKTDLSRGLIATDPEHDIAILSANRALVESVTDISIEPSKTVVGSQRIMVARAPLTGNRLWMTDSKVARRAGISDLDPILQQAAKRFGYTVSEDFRWIVHRRPFKGNYAGSAILDKEGKLVGMGVMWNVGSQECFAIPIDKVLALRNKTVKEKLYTQVKSFPKAGTVIASNDQAESNTDDKTGKANGPAKKAVQPGGAEGRIFDQLNLALDSCKEFGWLASNEAEADKLNRMAQLFVDAPAKLKELGDEKQVEQAEARFKQLFDSVQEEIDGIEKIPDQEVATSNQLMLDAMAKKNEAPLFLTATVHRPSIFGPKIGGKKTVTFKVDGTEELLITIVAENHFELRPGTRWLLVGKVHRSRKITVTTTQGEKEECIRTDIRYVFEIVD